MNSLTKNYSLKNQKLQQRSFDIPCVPSVKSIWPQEKPALSGLESFLIIFIIKKKKNRKEESGMQDDDPIHKARDSSRCLTGDVPQRWPPNMPAFSPLQEYQEIRSAGPGQSQDSPISIPEAGPQGCKREELEILLVLNN